MKHVLITGYYGFSNYGDDLFVASLNRFLNTYSANITVISACPNIDGVESEWIIKNRYLRRFFPRFNLIGSLVRASSVILPALKADVIIHGGGSLFERDDLGVKRVIRLFKRESAKELCLGISVSKKALDNKLIYEYLKEMFLIQTRDKSSFDNLVHKHFPVEKLLHSGDLTSSFIYHSEYTQSEKKHGIGVALCRCGNYSHQEYVQIIQTAVDLAEKLNKRLSVFCLNKDDKELSKKLISYANARNVFAELVERASIEFIKEIQDCEFFLSMRLHGAITAYLRQVPFVLIEYDEKCTNFLDDISYCKFQRVRNLERLSEVCEETMHQYEPPKKAPKVYVEEVEKSVNLVLDRVFT